MIPEKIQLRNFMSYREDLPPLVLDGIHVAVLSGENGAGKSALLDAITWALWGKARISVDDELIAQGEQEMEVDLQFTLAGGRYRVKRQRSSARRGQTLLDIQIENGSSWRPLGGDSVRQTQAIINNLLRMEYDTFINSAFLVQGKADEFTRKTPAERKQVLAEILGLTEYERLEARAKERVKELDDRIKGMKALIEAYQQHVDRREFLVAEEISAQKRVDTLRSLVDETEAQFAQAQERRRTLEAQRDQRDREQTALNNLLQSLEETRTDAARLQRDVDHARSMTARRAEIEAGGAALAAARRDLIRLDGLLEQAIGIRDERRLVEERISNARRVLESKLDLHRAAVAQAEATIARRPAVAAEAEELATRIAGFEADHQLLGAIRAERDTLEEQGQTLSSLLIEQQRMRGQIDVRHDSLIAAREEQNRRLIDLDRQLRDEERWREEYATATAQQRAIQRDERRLSELRAQDQLDTQRLGELKARSEAIQAHGKEVKEKLALLQHSGDTTCPLCSSEIGHSGIAEIERSYTVERDQLRVDYLEAKREADVLELALDSRRREINGLERKVGDIQTVVARIARLENQLHEAEEARSRRAEIQATLLTLEGQLANHDYAHDERAALSRIERDILALGLDEAALAERRRANSQRLAELEQRQSERARVEARAAVLAAELARIETTEQQLVIEHDQALTVQVQLDSNDFAAEDHALLAELNQRMDRLGYGRNAHNEARALVTSLEFWEAESQQLRDATALLDSNERQLKRMHELLTRYEAEAATLRSTLAELTAALAGLPAAIRQTDDLTALLQRKRQELAIAQRDLGGAQQKLQEVEEVAAQLKEKHKESDALVEERELYGTLVTAFGKKGIQAMLIETAIPELERESNALLSRMTDNQMHLSFETQRETKKGDTSETLDIQIADTQGTRRYDLYSGGEAFRINFAIRIAMSKLLARRAGANLQTLIIDEGFGSQDGRGRERLVEAITSIQEDFKRILVITHIQELKDLFPVQIEITKTDAGSIWEVN